MRKYLIILFLLITTLAGAQTIWYIDDTGSDVSGNGSAGKPWATLKHAADTVTGANFTEDTIHVNAGIYTETAASLLSVGVSIVGDGDASIITSAAALTWMIKLSSPAEGTNGNQTIRNLKFDGDLTALRAIAVYARSNVLIHHCTFVDLFSMGVQFTGNVDGDNTGAPAVWSTGNKFYNNTMTNCAEGGGLTGSYAGLNVAGQSGMLVYNNTITQTDRGVQLNGQCIKFAGDGYNKGLKIYSNTLTMPFTSLYNFPIELWNEQGGLEIYDNDISGCVDLASYAGCVDPGGVYGYAVSIHDNEIGPDALQTSLEWGINLEHTYTGGVYIYNNLIKNVFGAVHFSQEGSYNPYTVEDVYIYYNIFQEMGRSGMTEANAINWLNSEADATYDNINILNNVLYCATASNTLVGMRFNPNDGATFTDLTIRNNIIQGWDYYAIRFINGDYTDVSIENNLFYSNGSVSGEPNIIKYEAAATFTNRTAQNNLTVDPEFTTPGTDYTLQATSDCIDAGLGVGLTLDYAGNAVGASPDIGAYEFGGAPPTPPPNLPEITTTLNYHWSSGAKITGTAIDDGGGTITAKGICYSTSANPTTADSKISGGTGTTEFFVRITGLANSTTYHARAYCTNAEGTTYGADVSFTTPVRSFVQSTGKVVTSGGKIVVN